MIMLQKKVVSKTLFTNIKLKKKMNKNSILLIRNKINQKISQNKIIIYFSYFTFYIQPTPIKIINLNNQYNESNLK